MEHTRESQLVAELRQHIGTLPVKLFTQLLQEKEKSLKERLVTELDPKIAGRILECKDLLKCLSQDFS